MSRNFFGLEKGIDIYAENGALQARILTGTAAPTGTGDQSTAPIGSIYLRSGTGELYQKIANAGNSADWQLNGASSATIGVWRPEKVVLVTNATQGAGTRDVVASPFSDDEGTAVPLSAFVVGKYIISDADGTPVLLEITNVAGNNVTFATAGVDPLVAQDTFVVQYYLPDTPDAQEAEAIVNYNGSVMVKIADVNWNLADGITLNGYTESQGPIVGTDTVQVAIQKTGGDVTDMVALSGVARGAVNLGTFTGATILDNRTIKQALQDLESAYEETDLNVDDLITLSGVAENSTNLGTFTGDIIPDNQTVKQALQALETELVDTRQNVDDLITLSGVAENATNFGTFTGGSLADNQTAKQLFQRIETLLEQMRGVQVTGITAAATVDQVPVASVKACKWLVEAQEDATPANKIAQEIYALNDGSTNVDDTAYAKLKVGAAFNLTLSVDIAGGNMRLRAASSTAGVTVTARRIEVVKSVL